MNVAIVSTYEGHGGAAAAASRLEEALRRDGRCSVKSFARFSRNGGTHTDVGTDSLSPRDLRVRLAPSHLQQRIIESHRSELTNTLFTAGNPAWDVSAAEVVAEAEVVNLHWVSHFINGESLRRLHESRKTIVWTLHDERPFTGGCHYTTGCEGFRESCRNCPQLLETAQWVAERQFDLFASQVQDIPIHFVSPSKWLAEQVRKSAVFASGNHSVQVIPNSLDLDVFQPLQDGEERSKLRVKWGLPQDSLCLVAGSVSWLEERKGSRQLGEALERLSRKVSGIAGLPPICLVTYGKEAFPSAPFPVVNTGTISGEAEMASLLKCCDLYLSMTREDNLPNTHVESISCGLPVISTGVGGVPDIVSDGVEGVLVDRDDVEAMSEAILRAIRNPDARAEWRRNCRVKAMRDYSFQAQAERYADLFASLSNRERKLRARESGAEGIKLLSSKMEFPADAVEMAARDWMQLESLLTALVANLRTHLRDPGKIPGLCKPVLGRLFRKLRRTLLRSS